MTVVSIRAEKCELSEAHVVEWVWEGVSDRDILTFISTQAVLTQPHLTFAREEAEMREKERAGDLGKREDERRNGWGKREWKAEIARK